jgi:hypothetical protein
MLLLTWHQTVFTDSKLQIFCLKKKNKLFFFGLVIYSYQYINEIWIVAFVLGIARTVSHQISKQEVRRQK